MKTLAKPVDAAEIRDRILRLTPEDAAEWGVMSVDQMICHVREGYVYALAETAVELIALPYPPSVVKQFALKTPTHWPHSTTTIPQLELDAPGMVCKGFAQDRGTLLEAFERFCALTDHTRDHPFFGSMEQADWMRWGYLHADHHLRQFHR